MKKYLFLFVTAVSLALFSGRAHAQRYLPGMKGVELRGGFANGSKSPLNHYAGFAVSGYTKRADRWGIGAEYLMKNYGYRNVNVPCAQFTAEGGLQSPNQKIPDRKTKCVIKTHINIKQNVIFGAKLKPV